MCYSKRVFVCVFTFLLIAEISAESQAKTFVDKLNFSGWNDCYKINSGIAEVIVAPAIGRAVSFRALGGPNVFYLVNENKGKVRKSTESYISFGGLYTWLGPQSHWRLSADQKKAGTGGMAEVPFDGVAHEVKNVGPNSITTTRSDTDVYGIMMDKTYALTEDIAKFIYTVKITNISNFLLRWSIWNLAAVNPRGKVVFEAPGEWSDLQFCYGDEESSIEAYKPYIQFTDGLAVLDFTAMDAMGKKLFVKPNGSYILQYISEQYWLVRTFPKQGEYDLFTDNNSQIEIWADRSRDGVFEIETLSCDIAIEPGESYSWQETFEIKSSKDLTCPSKNLPLKRLVSSVLKNN